MEHVASRSVGASSEYNKRNITLTLTLSHNLPLLLLFFIIKFFYHEFYGFILFTAYFVYEEVMLVRLYGWVYFVYGEVMSVRLYDSK